ncbi:MAG: mannosyltransferase, partial [Bacteroidota bacterium]
GLLILLFWPLYDRALVHGMSSSISLYFQKFEFNASIYYLVRELGFLLKGYNVIATAGPWLSVVTFLLILGLALFSNPQKDRTPSVWLWILFVYFSMATIVHPWYVTSLIALGVLTKYQFPILWSGLIFLSYLGYNETGYDENMLVVIIEYGLLFTFIAYEVNQVLKQRKLSKIAVR